MIYLWRLLIRTRLWFGLSCLILAACGRLPLFAAPTSPPLATATPAPTPTAAGISVTSFTTYQPDADCPAKVRAMRTGGDASQPLYERYKDLRLIDVHNHGASNNPLGTMKLHDTYHLDGTALFGNISEPDAISSDQLAFQMYTQRPEAVYPFFSGIPLMEARGVEMARENLEQGYFGIGEIVGASTYSLMTKDLPWKADTPNSGSLPEIYQLSARYHAPVLLHIDPPGGKPIEDLEAALDANPQAILIFGHANAYNPPENIEPLLTSHPNLYIDFFAGFTEYNSGSTNHLSDFVPLIEKYPDHFMVSTDSGFEVGETWAIRAMYDLIDLLNPETACKVAHQNFDAIIEAQPPTETQVATILELSRKAGLEGTRPLNKRMANELILELKRKSGK